MEVKVEHLGDYYWVEVYDGEQILIRVGLDHKPGEEELNKLLSQTMTKEVADIANSNISQVRQVE